MLWDQKDTFHPQYLIYVGNLFRYILQHGDVLYSQYADCNNSILSLQVSVDENPGWDIEPCDRKNSSVTLIYIRSQVCMT